MKKNGEHQSGLYFQFFKRQYPTWIYAVAMLAFALSLFVWIKFFLVVNI